MLLIGMMGSGKTTVGRILSELTGWPYLDNDELVHRLFAMTPRQILAAHGEGRLRAAEVAALDAGLSSQAPSIVAAAAGTILDATVRRRLGEAGVVVWLRTNAAALERRAGAGAHRPWIETGGNAWIETATRQRLPLYAGVADVVVHTDAGSPAESAQRVLDELARFPACSAVDRTSRPPE